MSEYSFMGVRIPSDDAFIRSIPHQLLHTYAAMNRMALGVARPGDELNMAEVHRIMDEAQSWNDRGQRNVYEVDGEAAIP